ncbi:MAG: hypothetical protein ACT4R6_14295 [Gemmatimonadaceae bacterium]
MTFTNILALVSDGRRAAVARLLTSGRDSTVQPVLFAEDVQELSRALSGDALVLLDGRRMDELAATMVRFPGRDAMRGPRLELGEGIERWLLQQPRRTAMAWREALGYPRAWSVKRVAHSAGVSTRQLVRQSRRAGHELPPKDLLLAARIASVAVAARSNPRISVAELAHSGGWVDARSLRAALRRIGIGGLAALAACDDVRTVSAAAVLLARRRP